MASVAMETSFVIEMIFIVFIFIITVSTNIITLCVMWCTDYLRNINRVYLYSITISDLCIGIFVLPFALYCAVIYKLDFASINPKLCHFQAYMTVVFFLAGLYALSWMNVDHYVAVRKPERYKIMMSPPRSLCWILFAWIAAVSFCCPPLLNFNDYKYYSEVYMCTINVSSVTPYFITASVLALFPAFFSILITDVYLFTHGFRKKQKMYEAVMLDVSSRPRNYQMNFLVTIIFIGTWLPWCILRLCSFYENSIPQELHFYTFWIAMGNGFYKFFVYSTMSIEYRRGLRELFQHCCKCLPCKCLDRCLPRPPAATNYVSTRVVTKPSTSGPPPVHL